MGAFFSWLVAKLFSDAVVRWVATKVLLTGVVVVVLPIVLNNLIYDLMNTTFTWMASHTDSSSASDPSLSYTGLIAWFISGAQIPQAVSVIVSALSARLALRHIPFLRF